MSRMITAITVWAFLACAATAALAIEQKPVLTLEMAKKMADACEAIQKKEGWRPVNIAIYDDGGNLTLFRRQNKAFLGSIQIAQMKGHSSASFPFPTRVFQGLAFGQDGKPPRVPGIAFIPGIASFPGGLPIMTADGQQIGAIGVSGATADEDEMCGKTAIAAIAEMVE